MDHPGRPVRFKEPLGGGSVGEVQALWKRGCQVMRGREVVDAERPASPKRRAVPKAMPPAAPVKRVVMAERLTSLIVTGNLPSVSKTVEYMYGRLWSIPHRAA
jgi:hypothetical protein